MAQSNGDEWKKKYFDNLDYLERKEKEWGEVENLLRQFISRLTLAADPSEATLQPPLEELRRALRSGKPSRELERLFATLSDTIVKLDAKRRTTTPLDGSKRLLEELVAGIAFPEMASGRARKIAKEIEALKPGSDPLPLVERLAALLNDSFAALTSPEEETADAGLLGKLFKRKEESGIAAPAGEDALEPLAAARRILTQLIAAAVGAQDVVLDYTRRVRSASSEKGLADLAIEIGKRLGAQDGEGTATGKGTLELHEVLMQLVERLDIPAEQESELLRVKERLVRPILGTELPRILGEIADLVASLRLRMQRDKEEIETFLVQITQRLTELESGFNKNVELQMASFEDGKALGDAVRTQVINIEQSVNSAQELTTLKSSIQEHLENIRSHMTSFRGREDQRLQQAEEQIHELNEKLKLMERESDGLRTRIKEERDKALVDPLTGIPNRLAYNERIEQEYARWKRYKAPLSVAVWDVDKFKRINDSYGHQAGDKVLTIVARMLHKQVRETDFVARFGGEEFVMLLPETELKGALLAADKLRKAVEACEFHYRGTRVPITISCGLSEFREGDEAEQVFERADAALYEAKEQGRNQCRTR